MGSIAVTLVGAARIECRGEGHLRLPATLGAQRSFEMLLAEDEARFDLLFDGSAIDTFEDGLPMVWIRWLIPRVHRFRRVAIVGRPGPMLAAARPFPYLLPTLPVALFEDRQEALAFLQRQTSPGDRATLPASAATRG